MSERYKHSRDAWIDVETADHEFIYCNRCAEAECAQLSERFEADDELRELGLLARSARADMRVGAFHPHADDACDKCGVLARQQGGEDDAG